MHTHFLREKVCWKCTSGLVLAFLSCCSLSLLLVCASLEISFKMTLCRLGLILLSQHLDLVLVLV